MKPIVFLTCILLTMSCNYHHQDEVLSDSGNGGANGPGLALDYAASGVQEDAEIMRTPVAAEKFAEESLNNTIESSPGTKAIGIDKQPAKQKISKDGSMSVKSREIGSSKITVDSLVKKLNGYYEKEDLQ